MKLIATMAVRNEDWVLGLSLRAVLMWCDAVVVGLHSCTDRSRAIVDEVIRETHERGEKGRIALVIDNNPVWDEMPQRQNMLNAARRMGATHIAIVDADEVISANLLGFGGDDRAIGWLAGARNDGHMLQLPLYYLRGGLGRYHSNGVWGNRITDVAFADNPLAHWGGDNFHRRAPRGVAWQPYQPIQQGQGGVMHLWGCSERRLKAKSALYKLTERLRWPEKSVESIDEMYSWAIHGAQTDRYQHAYGRPSFGTPATWTYELVPTDWWRPYDDLLRYVDVDREPWQIAECQRLLAENPGLGDGLDLFGIV